MVNLHSRDFQKVDIMGLLRPLLPGMELKVPEALITNISAWLSTKGQLSIFYYEKQSCTSKSLG
jgi:hypothetical protein